MLAIKDYREVFWLKESARYKDVTWGKFPVSRNSTSYRRLMRSREGHTAYCVFVAIWRLVTRAKSEDGRLVVKGCPITTEDIYDECGIDRQKIEQAMSLLQTPEIGWITGIERDSTVQETGDSRATPVSLPCDKRESPVNRPFTSTSSSSLSSSPSFSSGFRARAIVEGPRTEAWNRVEKSISEILGRDVSVNELAKIGPWADAQSAMGVVIRGHPVPGAELVQRALDAARSTGVNGTVSQILAWCESVLDRCRRQQCWPDESPKLKPTKFKTVGGTSKATLDRIAAEEA